MPFCDPIAGVLNAPVAVADAGGGGGGGDTTHVVISPAMVVMDSAIIKVTTAQRFRKVFIVFS